jgi:two-component system nitrate/nitrite response regulator NarL
MRTPSALCDSAQVRTVLIVDDHPSFRSAARALLQAAGYEVVGEAEDGASAVEAAERLRPDVVLVDVRLPDVDGFEVGRRLAAGERPPVVVLTSSHAVSSFRKRLEANPSFGFIPKSELSGEALASLVS